MKIKRSSYFLILLLVLLLLAIVLSFRMKSFEAKLLPLAFAGVTSVLIAIQLGRELTAKTEDAGKTAITTAGSYEVERGSISQLLIVVAWLVGLLVSIWLFGFYLSISAFIIAYMILHGSRWLETIIATISVLALMYGVFGRLLGLPMYLGLIFNMLGYY